MRKTKPIKDQRVYVIVCGAAVSAMKIRKTNPKNVAKKQANRVIGWSLADTVTSKCQS
jgi:hypothetical protein